MGTAVSTQQRRNVHEPTIFAQFDANLGRVFARSAKQAALVDFLPFGDLHRIEIGNEATPPFAMFDNDDLAIAAIAPGKGYGARRWCDDARLLRHRQPRSR